MDLNTWLLFGVIAVLALNQAVMRVERFVRDSRIFWSVQLIDVTAACLLIGFGLPGFEMFPAVPPVLGLVFLLHAAQNHQFRNRWLTPEERAERDALRAEADRFRATRPDDESG